MRHVNKKEKKLKKSIAKLAAATLILLPNLAYADSHYFSIQQFLEAGRITGSIRSYYINQIYSGSILPNKYAYSLGGMLKMHSAPLYGVSAAMAFYTANSLGANDVNAPGYTHLDALLMGEKDSLNVLGQAYLQYQDHWLHAKVGNILLNTPWMNPSDAFMIPSTFQALSVRVTPFKNLQVIGLREFRFKNRIQDHYYRETLLNQNPLYPQMPDHIDGTLAFGVKAHWQGWLSTVWYYQFYDLANLFYGTAYYSVPDLPDGLKPFADFQYAREWANGAQYAGPINATIFGGIVGLQIPVGQIFAAYNAIPGRSPFSMGGRPLYNGGFVSPYTQQYSADPLYTSIMDYGLVSASAAGHAWKFGFLLHPIHQLRIKYSYSMYETQPYLPNVDANYLDLTYTPGGFWKGLSLRNRLAVVHSNPYAKYQGTLIDDRLMLQYAF